MVVAGLFLAVPARSGSGAQDALDALARSFVDPAAGYRLEDIERIEAAIEATLPPSESVFRPGGRLSASSKAVLAVETVDGVLERVRYRVSYGLETVPAPPAIAPLPVSLVQIDRFHLGPAIHEELVAEHGTDHVAPPETFGDGPHVSWRIVMRPIMGHAAAIVAAGRRELSDEDARAMSCLGAPCLSTVPEVPGAAPWDELRAMDDDPDTTALPEAVYPAARDGLPTPAAVIDLLTAELTLEPREGAAAGAPFAVAVLETGLGQDRALDAAIREGALMDDSLRAVWRRLAALPAGPDEPPQRFAARAFECRRGPEFAPPGELCP